MWRSTVTTFFFFLFSVLLIASKDFEIWQPKVQNFANGDILEISFNSSDPNSQVKIELFAECVEAFYYTINIAQRKCPAALKISIQGKKITIEDESGRIWKDDIDIQKLEGKLEIKEEEKVTVQFFRPDGAYTYTFNDTTIDSRMTKVDLIHITGKLSAPPRIRTNIKDRDPYYAPLTLNKNDNVTYEVLTVDEHGELTFLGEEDIILFYLNPRPGGLVVYNSNLDGNWLTEIRCKVPMLPENRYNFHLTYTGEGMDILSNSHKCDHYTFPKNHTSTKIQNVFMKKSKNKVLKYKIDRVGQ